MVPFGFPVCFSTNTVVKPCESCTLLVMFSLLQIHVSEFMYVLFPHLSIFSLFFTSQVEGWWVSKIFTLLRRFLLWPTHSFFVSHPNGG